MRVGVPPLGNGKSLICFVEPLVPCSVCSFFFALNVCPVVLCSSFYLLDAVCWTDWELKMSGEHSHFFFITMNIAMVCFLFLIHCIFVVTLISMLYRLWLNSFYCFCLCTIDSSHKVILCYYPEIFRRPCFFSLFYFLFLCA